MNSIRVILSDSEQGPRKVSRILLKNILTEGCEIIIEASPYGEEVVELAEQNPPDLFLFYHFNNIRFRDYSVEFPNARYKFPQCETRFEKALELVSHIKETYDVPIFVLTGWEDSPLIIKRLRETADWYSKCPFEPSDFEGATRKYLLGE